MKKKINVGILIGLISLLGSCGKPQDPFPIPDDPTIDPDTPTPDPEPEPDPDPEPDPEPDPDPEPEPDHNYVSLDKAISNTSNYSLATQNIGGENVYVEINQDNGYYYSYNMGGYIIVDEDPDYYHSFSVGYEDDDSFSMNVYGRTYKKEERVKFSSYNIISVIKKYESKFEKINENTYHISNNSDYIWDMANFFQSHLIKYATDSYITIGKDDRLSHLEFHEIYENYHEKTLDYSFSNDSIRDCSFYTKWANNGAITHNRISDIKSTYNGISLYENDEISLKDLIVTSIDASKNIIVSELNYTMGHIGLNIGKTSLSLNIGEIIDVTGTVSSGPNGVYLKGVTITKTNKSTELIPYFEEDYIEGGYGGGIYAFQYFRGKSIYSDSVYSTFAYLKSKKETSEGTVATLIFPSMNTGITALTIDFLVSNSLDESLRSEINSFLDSLTVYGSQGGSSYVYFEKIIVKYDDKGVIYFEAGSETHLELKKNFSELLEKHFNLQNFPYFESAKGSMSYKFGGISGMYLESEYGIPSKTYTNGIFGGFSEFTNASYLEYISKIEDYGFSKWNEINTTSGSRHIIYQKDDIVLDISNKSEDENAVYIWVYRGDMVRTKTLTEKLEEAIGSWYNASEFPRLQDTYEADYEVHSLESYAGVDYEEPLTVVTCDVTKEFATNYYSKYSRTVDSGYRKAVLDSGFKTVRDDKNLPLTQKVRGQNQYTFYQVDSDIKIAVTMYPTTDYTYLNHSQFDYRIELAIYKGEGVLNVPHYNNIDSLIKLYKDIDPTLGYEVTLPEDSVVEIWKNDHNLNYKKVTYGYGTRDEAFVLTKDVDGAFDSMTKAVEDAGYTLNFGSSWSKLYYKKIDQKSYYICFFKETRSDNNYLRIMNDIGGVSFWGN